MLAVIAITVACGGVPSVAPAGGELSIEQVAKSGALSYAVGFARATDRSYLVAVELEIDFYLVVREIAPVPRRAPDLIEHRRVRLGSHRYDVSDLAIAQTGDAALVASADGTVREVDLIAGRVSPSWHMGDAVTAVAVSPDGTSIAAGGASGLVCLRRRADGALLQCLVGHAGPVSDLAFDPSGARLATSSWDGTVKVLSLPALAQLALLDTGGSANQLAFSPDGERIAIAMSGSPPALGPERGLEERDPLARILLWRAHRGAPAPRPLAGHQGPVTAVAWLDRTRLLSGSWDRSVRLWDSRQEREIGRAVGFAHIVRHVATDPDGRRAAAAAWAPRGEGPATVLLGLAPAP